MGRTASDTAGPCPTSVGAVARDVVTNPLASLRTLVVGLSGAGNVAARPGGVAQLVERLTGSQEVRGFESLRLHSKTQAGGCCSDEVRLRPGAWNQVATERGALVDSSLTGSGRRAGSGSSGWCIAVCERKGITPTRRGERIICRAR